MADEEKPSTVRLAEALQKVPGMPPYMIQRAIDGYYAEYESEFALPLMQLRADLLEMSRSPTTGPKATRMLKYLVGEVANGAFDASRAEADAWALSEDGVETFKLLFDSARETRKKDK